MNNIIKSRNIFTGDEKVLKDWKEYFSEYKTIVEARKDVASWCENNKFTVLIEKNTGELSSVRYSKKNKPSVSYFLVEANKIPIFAHIPPKTASELREMANGILNLFNNEVKSAEEQGKLPVLLTDYCEYSDYKGWSIRENKEILIYDYKTYTDKFAYSEINVVNPDDIKDNDKYTVILPSNKLISALGLNLHPEIWEIKQSWDKWYSRKEKESNIGIVPDKYKELYMNCLNVVNKSRINYLGLSDEFSLLETRLYRFEKLLSNSASNDVIYNEVENLRKSYEEIKDVI